MENADNARTKSIITEKRHMCICPKQCDTKILAKQNARLFSEARDMNFTQDVQKFCQEIFEKIAFCIHNILNWHGRHGFNNVHKLITFQSVLEKNF